MRFLKRSATTWVPRLLLGAALVSLACHRHDKVVAPGTPVVTVVVDSLTFTRADSTVVESGATPFVCCGLYDPGFVNEHAMRIVMYDPANTKVGWQILILTDRAQAGAVTTLPTVVVPPSKVPHVSMFAADSLNELSSDTEESSGTITVHSFECTSTAIRIDFSVDAVLGSEFGDGPSMRVQGAFRAAFPATACP
jgi:hypothetical protein